MPDFYPRRDSAFLYWSANFAGLIAASPGDYGISEEQASGFAALQQAYAQWYVRATQPSTRTMASVRMKDEVRAALMSAGRPLARLIRARPETTSEQLVALGLGVRAKARRAVPGPSASPRVWVKKVVGQRVSLRLLDRDTGRARKPAGAAMAVLLYTFGQATPADEGAWRFGGVTGDPKLTWSLPVGPRIAPGGGMEPVWLIACWVNDRGVRGPWSEPVKWWVSGQLGPGRKAAARAA